MVQSFEYMSKQIDAVESRRDWNSLPFGFKTAAVRDCFARSMNPYFAKNEIRQRIAASKATSFEELREAIA